MPTITRQVPILGSRPLVCMLYNMTKEKDTTIDQLFALILRLWRFLRKRISEFDGDLFQKVISDRNDPFWKKLDELCEACFTITFKFLEIGEPIRITTDHDKSTHELIKELGSCRLEMTGTATNILDSEVTNHSASESGISFDIVFLYPTRDISHNEVLAEFQRRGWENAHLKDSLRILIANPEMCLPTSSNGKFIHNICFINERDHDNSIELGVDGMGYAFLARSTRKYLCYAARIPTKVA